MIQPFTAIPHNTRDLFNPSFVTDHARTFHDSVKKKRKKEDEKSNKGLKASG